MRNRQFLCSPATLAIWTPAFLLFKFILVTEATWGDALWLEPKIRHGYLRSMRGAAAVFTKDLNSELRTRYALNSLLMFVVVTLSIILFDLQVKPFLQALRPEFYG